MARSVPIFRKFIHQSALRNTGKMMAERLSSWHSFLGPVQRCHYRSTSIPKLTMAVRIYSCLARHGEVHDEAICKLCQLLLHPFPSVSDAVNLAPIPERAHSEFMLIGSCQVRNAAADGLFLVKKVDEMRMVNWAQAPKDLRVVVEDIRRRLGLNESSEK